MTAGQITDSAERLTALGYRRVSRKHGIVARIDRIDWAQAMAVDHFRVPADYFDAKTGAPSDSWCDYYRRVHAKDQLILIDGYDSNSRPIVMEKFMQIPPSGFDDCGYVDPVTLQTVEPPKLPADVMEFLQRASRYDQIAGASDDLLEKYGGALA